MLTEFHTSSFERSVFVCFWKDVLLYKIHTHLNVLCFKFYEVQPKTWLLVLFDLIDMSCCSSFTLQEQGKQKT